jgi:hypothetical protein
MNWKVNPGSKEAIELGCLCAVWDNNYGKGNPMGENGEIAFFTEAECPLHGDGD